MRKKNKEEDIEKLYQKLRKDIDNLIKHVDRADDDEIIRISKLFPIV